MYAKSTFILVFLNFINFFDISRLSIANAQNVNKAQTGRFLISFNSFSIEKR